MKLIFEWDGAKANANLKKHNIRFEEGKTIFNDPFLFTFLDDRLLQVRTDILILVFPQAGVF